MIKHETRHRTRRYVFGVLVSYLLLCMITILLLMIKVGWETARKICLLALRFLPGATLKVERSNGDLAFSLRLIDMLAGSLAFMIGLWIVRRVLATFKNR